ncbi:MAG: glycosyltransferase family 4 protein [Actinomycetota bacterium]|nr:glycosyltransferase family 4 protein [Actinomycetota bacterium]
MKIAIVSPYSWAYPGGVNSHVRGLASEMQRRGHEITVIAPELSGEIPMVSTVDAGRSVPIPANGSIAHIALSPAAGKLVRKVVRESSFEILHVHEPFVPLLCRTAVLAATCGVVATFHAAGSKRSFPRLLARATSASVFKKIDGLIAVSPSAKSTAMSTFGGDYKLIPNGVDTKLFCREGTHASLASPGDSVILFVGRDEPRKGLGVLLRAFELLLDEIPHAKLALVGPGLSRPRVLGSLPPRVRDGLICVGEVGSDELPTYYRAADIFCAPSIASESFGIILVEAMACGTPVIASDIPGYRYVVEVAGGGFLFPPGNAEELAATLARLLTDEDARKRVTASALEGVGRFSWERVGEEIEKCYLEVLTRGQQ